MLLALGKWECLNVCHFLDAGREREKSSVMILGVSVEDSTNNMEEMLKEGWEALLAECLCTRD